MKHEGPNGPLWKYVALVSYVGTRFCGWQKQVGSAADGGPSIQETIDNALREMTQEPAAKVIGSGRTDSGVHATGQVMHFVLRKKEWDPQILRKGLNSKLRAPQIQILDVRAVPIEFHAQHSAQKKQYSYYFQQGPAPLPAYEKFSWWIRKRLDVAAMQDALSRLQGEHDFLPFQASGSKVSTTIRQILEAEVSPVPIPFPGVTQLQGNPVGLIRVRLVGTGFLKQMVRGIAGTLLEVGDGRRPPRCFSEILETKDRQLVGMTAPSRGLWLERVWYPGLEW